MHLSSIFTILSLFCYVNCEFPTIEIKENEDGLPLLVKALFIKINWIIIEIEKVNNKIDQQENFMKKITENFPKHIEDFNQTLNKILTDGLETKQQIFQRIDLQDNVMKKSSKDIEDINHTLNKILTDGMEMKQQILQKFDLQENCSKDMEDFNQTLNKILTDGLETKQQLLQKIDLQDNVVTKSSKEIEDFSETLNKILSDGLETKQQIFQRIDVQDNLITKSSQEIVEKTKETANWLVILRRQDGTVNFDRKWSDYQNGFGNPKGEFFIGLNQLHAITTNSEPQELLVVLRDFNNETRYAKYDHFVVGSAKQDYELKKLGDYSGNAGDSLSQHVDFPFSTKDQDNDEYCGNCASSYKGGWWFDECYASHLTGPYFQQPTSNVKKGIIWNTWHGDEYSLKFVKMMLRPNSKFRNDIDFLNVFEI